jgi:NADPH-dependent curcumin reductase CurA
MRGRRIILLRRPAGIPTTADFELREDSLPDPANGEILVANSHVSLQPSARVRMAATSTYAAPTPIGGVPFADAVGVVVRSRDPGWAEGERVVIDGGWQTHALVRGANALKLDPRIRDPLLALGCLGRSGMTAYVGITDIGKAQAGDTVVVSAASGAVGSIAGQIAKLRGCRVVGIAGGAEKCRHVVEELGFDACLDHRSPDLAPALAKACPRRIDVDFENVGGAVRDIVWDQLADFARVVLCGLVSQYNESTPVPSPDWSGLLFRRVRVQGFLLRDHLERRAAFLNDMLAWLEAGRIVHREHVTRGLENLPAAYADMLTGRNLGKAIVALA